MKRDHLYVERKHPMVWLSMACMLASAVSAIILGSGHWGWMVAAIGLYALIVLLSGDEMLYRTAVPVWILGISFAVEYSTVLAWIVCLVFCTCYSVIISGAVRKVWLLPCCLIAATTAVFAGGLPNILAAAGLLLLCPAIKVHNDGQYHPTWGDRIDGRRVRTAPAMEHSRFYVIDLLRFCFGVQPGL